MGIQWTSFDNVKTLWDGIYAIYFLEVVSLFPFTQENYAKVAVLCTRCGELLAVYRKRNARKSQLVGFPPLDESWGDEGIL